MATVAFDTLKFAQTLRNKAQFTPAQAEGIALAFAEASSEQLATKSDIAALDTKIDLLRWMLGFTLAAVMAALYILIRR